MTKTLAMASHKNHDLNVMKVGNVFDFQVIYMLYWRFHFENDVPINCLFTQRN
jgi:hypothetical protein